LEERESGFEEAAFVRRFTSAGGVWLRFPPGRYFSYDGTHLTRDSAVRFSRDLAERLRASHHGMPLRPSPNAQEP
jgi:hypothetical protein